jgi:hypothetical protein
MATQPQPSSAPMFETRQVFYPGELTEDLDTDLIVARRGANQFLGDDAAHHAGQSTVGPRGNTVQSGALALLGTHSQLGRPNKANPIGAQNG